MVSRRASTVREYLAALPEERREAVSAVRDLVRRHLPAGYREAMNWGMITWELPLSKYPDTYNGQPLCYVGLAAQKNHNALYLTGVYQDPEQETWLKRAFRDAGKKLDMGKSCLRFRSVEDLPLEAVGRIVAWTSPEKHIARYEASRRGTRSGSAKKNSGAKSGRAKAARAK
jgi:uncharacterized protein YdhG (YjbR/CyaY superfamily)